MLTKEEWKKIEKPFLKALTEAIFKSAQKHPEGFKEWLCGPWVDPSQYSK